jgi:feruloyl-CoA synthase
LYLDYGVPTDARFRLRRFERLQYWAATAPDRVLLASRDGEGWRKITYLEALNAARTIGQALLDRGLSLQRPVLILQANRTCATT